MENKEESKVAPSWYYEAIEEANKELQW